MAETLIIPGLGRIFAAPKNTKLPVDGIKAFTQNGAPPESWSLFGETSSENTLEFSIDGGDADVKRTWERLAARTIYADESWSIQGSAVEMSKAVLKRIYGGWDGDNGGTVIPAKKKASDTALVVLATDDSAKMAWYIPNVSLSHGDAPSVDLENFFEAPFAGTFQAAGSGTISLSSTGEAGLFQWFTPEDFVSAP